MSGHALGLIETRGLVGSIEACDAAAKAAQVTITSAEVTDGGLVTLKIAGDLAAVRAAVVAGSAAAARIGELITAHVIARPDENLEVFDSVQKYVSKYRTSDEPSRTTPTPSPAAPKPTPVPKPARPKAAPASQVAPAKQAVPAPKPPEPKPESDGPVTLAQMQAMPVVKLRQFARTVTNLPIQGRQISMANKTKLIEAIETALNLE